MKRAHCLPVACQYIYSIICGNLTAEGEGSSPVRLIKIRMKVKEERKEISNIIEETRKRCERVIERIGGISNINDSCKRTLLKLVNSELNFLHTRTNTITSTNVCSIGNNIAHMEAVLHLLHHPSINGVSRLCRPIPLSQSQPQPQPQSIHVDIVCTLHNTPVWIIVSHRNPNYISCFHFRIQQLLSAAHSSLIMKPSSIILFFSRGLPYLVYQKLQHDFGATELHLDHQELPGDWIHLLPTPTSFQHACVLQIKLQGASPSQESKLNNSLLNLNLHSPHLQHQQQAQKPYDDGDDDDDSSFSTLLSGLQTMNLAQPGALMQNHLINFDTTALIALVSGISNGCAHKLLATPEIQLRQRFKGNFDFVIAQVMSEMQNPIHTQLAAALSRKRGIICQSVHSELKELVSLCGGPNEKLRAQKILECLTIVPDTPSDRVMGLPTTRKLALKSKVVFGTGDHWHAPTLTANRAFVRAVSQTGMSLFTVEHGPRALIGD